MNNYQLKYATPSIILLQDLDNGVSITNSAEAVVAEVLNLKVFTGQRIFYIDTMGCVDELMHNGERFTGFKFGYDTINEFEREMLK